MTADELKADALTERLARAWIECDPNRGGDPDEITPLYVDDEYRDEPRWKWFLPRANALKEYLAKHGYSVVPT